MKSICICCLALSLCVVTATVESGLWKNLTVSSYEIDTGAQAEEFKPRTIHLGLPAGFAFEVAATPSFAIARHAGFLYIVGKVREGAGNSNSFLVVGLNETPPYQLRAVILKRAEAIFNANYAAPACRDLRPERQASWSYVLPLVGSPKGEPAFYIDRVECGEERSIHEGSIRRQAMRCSIPELECTPVGPPSTSSQVTGFGRYDLSYHNWGPDLVPFTADDSGHRQYRSYPGTGWIQDEDTYPVTSVELAGQRAYKRMNRRDNVSTVIVGGIPLDTLPGLPRPTSMVADNVWHHAHRDSYLMAVDERGKAFNPDVDRLVEYRNPSGGGQISVSVSNGTWPVPANSTCGAPFILSKGQGQFFVGRFLTGLREPYLSSPVNLIEWVNRSDYRQGLRLVAARASIGLGQAFVEDLGRLFTVEIYRNSSGQLDPTRLQLNVIGVDDDSALRLVSRPRCHCPEGWYWCPSFFCRPLGDKTGNRQVYVAQWRDGSITLEEAVDCITRHMAERDQEKKNPSGSCR